MLKFKKSKTRETINSEMRALGLDVDERNLRDGGDWVTYRGVYYDMPLNIVYNVCNGWFFVYDGPSGDLIASHKDSQLDEKEWYLRLLEIFYEK